MIAVVLDSHQRQHGQDHDTTLTTAETLANSLGDLGRHDQAAALLRQACHMHLADCRFLSQPPFTGPSQGPM